jgi:hypothetical protein
MKSKPVLSYSLIKKLLLCEMQAYFAHIKGLEKKQWKRYWLEGSIFQYGIYRLMVTKRIKVAEREMLEFMKKYLVNMRKGLQISSNDEREFIEVQSSMVGMLRGYAEKYERDLPIEKHIANEASIIYQYNNDFSFGVQLDNIIEVKKKWYLHEGKAWGTINSNTVENVKNNLQIATYFHIHNNFYKKAKFNIPLKPFSGIIFDAVQKPKIRQKAGESYRGFLKRLEAHYTGMESGNKFFKEVIDEPGISYEHLKDTIDSCAIRYGELLSGRKPLRTFADCSWCDFQRLCFDGETKKNLVFYRPSEYLKRYQGGEKK